MRGRILVAGALAGLLVGGLPASARPDAVAAQDQTVAAEADATPPVTTHRLDPPQPDLPDGTYSTAVSVTLYADDGEDGSGVATTQYRVDGGEWQTYGEEVLFDGTPESFLRWRQAPAGAFALLPDGSIQSVAGMGLLWYPKEYGDAALKVQFRDAAPDGFSNSGVFVRFPDPDAAVARLPQDQHACQEGGPGQLWSTWVAVACGHEIQIYDGATGEVQKTGSVYNFKSLGIDQARPVPKGMWSDYEVRTVGAGDYTVTVIRDGEVLNTFTNSPGQAATRDGDPPTDLRQFARGHFGLQNHLPNDVMQFRDVRVQHLTPEGGTFSVGDPAHEHGDGVHVVEYRSVDAAGNVEDTRSVTIRLQPT